MEAKFSLKKGSDGATIVSCVKTGTDGTVDTYTVTMDDGSQTTFQILNGYSIDTVEKTATVGLTDTYTITYTNGSISTFDITNGGNINEIWETLGTLGAKNLMKYPYTITTVEQVEEEGEVINIIGAEEQNGTALKVYGMSSQDGTPTPSNPVDIDSSVANFTSVGKNLHDVSRQLPRTNVYTTTTYNSDGTFTIDGTANGEGAQLNGIINGFSIGGLKAGDKLVFSYEVISGSASHLSFSRDTAIYIYKTGGNIGGIAFPSTLSKGDKGSAIIDITNDLLTDGKLVYNGVQMWLRSGDVFNNLQLAVMVRRYGTDDTFEPYKSTTKSTNITLRAIEVTSADEYNLVRDGKYYVADTIEGDRVVRRVGQATINDIYAIGLSAKYGRVNPSIVGSSIYKFREPSAQRLYCLMDRYIISPLSTFTSTNGTAFWNDTVKNLYLHNDAMTSLGDWQTWIANNPVTFYGILQTPTTETLTSEQIEALNSIKIYDVSTTISSPAPMATLVLEYDRDQANGITYTPTEEGLEVSGISTDISRGRAYGFMQGMTPLTLPSGSYKISGALYGCKLVAHSEDNSIYAEDTGSGATFTLTNATQMGVYAEIPNGANIDDIFKIMIDCADDTYDEYTEYVYTNKEMTDMLEGMGGIWKSAFYLAAGTTTFTITDASITEDSIIEIFSDNKEVHGDEIISTPIMLTSIVKTTGSLTVTFNALERKTTFWVNITNL